MGLAAALAPAGCGHAAPAPPGDQLPGHTLTVYTGLPLQGSDSAAAHAVLHGEQLALAQQGARVGRLHIVLRVLDDDTATSRGWDPGQASADAHAALADPTTVGYIGDFTSGATAITLPLLNRAGIPQITPTASAVGLTSSGPGASPGEPAKYYPSGRRTLVQLVPDDGVQAAAQVDLQRSLGCRRTYVLDDGEFDGADAAASFDTVAARRHLPPIAVQSFDPRAPDYRALAAAVARTSPDCVLISALPGAATTRLTTEVATALPRAWLLATASLAQTSFAATLLGGLPHRLDPRVLITAPVGAGTAAAAAFAAAFTARYGRPGPYAAYGYEAMRMLLSAIDRATDGGHDATRRSRVISALLGLRPRRSVLGSFSITREGRTTRRRYGVYLVRTGNMSLWTTIETSTE